ncbi:MAG: HDOD domain-containing protein [Chromatiaceae bacterium]|nr:HDOD domain-containing protein [Gammaproteobacteria bacterium]MCP5306137.1 HDOD domain-containing protein [Chromatiaceae bacterium]MCP5315947.1 HDOD domain-containing protein [Chromatiaceae bacterium]
MRPIAGERFEHQTTEQRVMVARQPIYNSNMGVFGYELLFRSPAGDGTGLKPTEATAQVLASTIMEFGLDKFVHGRKAVINVTPAFVEVISDVQLAPDQIILDIPGNMRVDEKQAIRLKELRELGYGLSVSGLANLKNPQLLPIASIFQVDVQKVRADLLDPLIKFLRRYDNLALQALKIETSEQYRTYCDKGFDYLQGYFLSKPRVYVSRNLTANKLAILQVLATTHNIDTPIEKLEQQITSDVSLSYKLLKLVNAPFFGLAREVDSIKHAIVLLGRDEIRKWISLLALGGMSDEPVAVMEIAVLRAKICELLAQRAGLPQDSYFTVGMFSALDLLMKQPIKSILAQLPLSESIKSAILEREGLMGEALDCAIAIENAQWSGIRFSGLEHSELSEAYRQAVEWTDDVMGHF